jgi:hypothetical protein
VYTVPSQGSHRARKAKIFYEELPEQSPQSQFFMKSCRRPAHNAHAQEAGCEGKQVVPVLNHAPVLRQSDIMNLVKAKMLGSRYQALATTHNKRDLEEENAYEYE